jgi:hypothetical protein
LAHFGGRSQLFKFNPEIGCVKVLLEAFESIRDVGDLSG